MVWTHFHAQILHYMFAVVECVYRVWNHRMYTFYDLIVECIHSMTFYIPYNIYNYIIHITCVGLHCNVNVPVYSCICIYAIYGIICTLMAFVVNKNKQKYYIYYYYYNKKNVCYNIAYLFFLYLRFFIVAHKITYSLHTYTHIHCHLK